MVTSLSLSQNEIEGGWAAAQQLHMLEVELQLTDCSDTEYEACGGHLGL